MTRTTRTKPAAVRRLATRITIGIAALATAVGVTVVTPATASAQYSATSSSNVASDANRALWLLVRWADTGRESLIYPGSDATVHHFHHPAPGEIGDQARGSRSA